MSGEMSSERIAFQGERGAFSEEAAIRLLGSDIRLVPRPTFEALFSTISEGTADAILVPIENSLAGSVHRCFDLLLESELVITREVIHPITHNLIGTPGGRPEEIASVESHPVALAQCENFFRAHPEIKRIVAEDTAGSVRAVMERGDPTRAAIAARRAAEIYGAKVLQEHLEDHRENYTRFLLLRPASGAEKGGNKLSLAVQLAHQPGSLHRALGIFSTRGINLTKIESRPIPGSPWKYRFYLDLQAALAERKTQEALEELRGCSETVRVLGCYPAYAGSATAEKSREGDKA
ncbi:MAG TPA: prephenate dehydratase [Candidatus Acidoferrum sp.]|nr:prephenate dehydratase [Candidatus Acidoferrum sp.]